MSSFKNDVEFRHKHRSSNRRFFSPFPFVTKLQFCFERLKQYVRVSEGNVDTEFVFPGADFGDDCQFLGPGGGGGDSA
jgi:hypothetical protein